MTETDETAAAAAQDTAAEIPPEGEAQTMTETDETAAAAAQDTAAEIPPEGEARPFEERLEGELFADLRETALRYIKDQDARWNECSESRQRQIIADVDRSCEDIVRSAVCQIAAHRWPAIAANVEQVVFKDGIKAVMTIAAGEPSRHELADRTGTPVMLVIADPKIFMTAKGTTVADPDQPTLPLEQPEPGDGKDSDESDAGDAGDADPAESDE